MGKVVHFEIPTDDIARASEFYRSIFGWDLRDMSELGMDYTIAMTVPVDERTQVPTEAGAINGGMMKRSDQTPSPVITIEVEEITAALADIEAKGGSTVQPRTPIEGMGAFAYFKDPEGNVMGLWETVPQG
jgi:predicted enzyme related to lactoylglutathione lyase